MKRRYFNLVNCILYYSLLFLLNFHANECNVSGSEIDGNSGGSNNAHDGVHEINDVQAAGTSTNDSSTNDSSTGGTTGDTQTDSSTRTCSSNVKDTSSSTCSTETPETAGGTSTKPPPLQQQNHNYVFPGCALFLAPSTIEANNAGLGIFTARKVKRGQPIAFPDIIIQLTDYDTKTATTTTTTTTTNYDNGDNSDNSDFGIDIGPLVHEYSWEAHRFGGQLEAKKVASILPGIGSIANAQSHFHNANALPYRPDVDEANVPRTDKPGAGSFTHYHNLTFFATKPMEPGTEIFVHYNVQDSFSWVANRTIVDFETKHENKKVDTTAAAPSTNTSSSTTTTTTTTTTPGRSVQWLTQNGICLDNIKPGRSKVKDAGRGALATRFIPQGSIVTSLPLVVIPHRDALLFPKPLKKTTTKKKKKQKSKFDKQLLLNYCFGHNESSVLFYPTSPVVNFINHAPTTLSDPIIATDVATATATDVIDKKKYTANVKMQWSTSFHNHIGTDWPQTLNLDQLKNKQSGLIMELIATRDISPKEEILLDYGLTWSDAWTKHVQSWKPIPNANAYAPSYVMEDVAGLLRTEKEQMDYPYPPNIEISCFYQYSVYHKKRNDGIVSSSTRNSESSGEATTVKWEMDRRTFEFKNLRPCKVLDREKLANDQWAYKIMMKNRYGLPKEEIIPKGELHVVVGVPRGAIRFTDKMYTTDQHLPNAFRHEIGIPDSIFPKQWKDLK